MKVLKGKASTAKLDDLHNTVAEVLSKELKNDGEVDTKLLAIAIKFLKDNDVTAEVLESDKIQSLTENIREIANSENKFEEISVDDMLAIAERK